MEAKKIPPVGAGGTEMTCPQGNGATVTRGKEFTQRELYQFHRFCCQYRDLVRGGGVPSLYQDVHFMLYQRFTYAAGVACE